MAEAEDVSDEIESMRCSVARRSVHLATIDPSWLTMY